MTDVLRAQLVADSEREFSAVRQDTAPNKRKQKKRRYTIFFDIRRRRSTSKTYVQRQHRKYGDARWWRAIIINNQQVQYDRSTISIRYHIPGIVYGTSIQYTIQPALIRTGILLAATAVPYVSGALSAMISNKIWTKRDDNHQEKEKEKTALQGKNEKNNNLRSTPVPAAAVELPNISVSVYLVYTKYSAERPFNFPYKITSYTGVDYVCRKNVSSYFVLSTCVDYTPGFRSHLR